ncbi:MAG: hypothetical protein RBT69_08655 [Spirochaetia bacterium]|jgi:hypothetical protein|nr:hypothetical protein [Spirochaetia bacterium]
MNNKILKNNTKLLFSRNWFLTDLFHVLMLSAIALSAFFLSSCATTGKTAAAVMPEPDLKQYVLEIEEKTDFMLPLYYSDIISFLSDSDKFITYDTEAGRYYIPGNREKEQKINEKQFSSNEGVSTVEVIPVSAEVSELSGFSCSGKDEVIYSSTEGDVYRNRKTGQGVWEEKKIFSADAAGGKYFTAMTADKENVYLYSHKDPGIYRYTHSGKAEAFIKLKYTDAASDTKIIAIDFKSSYLYLLLDSGIILLADYEERGVEAGYLPNDSESLSAFFTVKQEESSSDILLARKAEKGTTSYSFFPLSSMHRMRIEEGYIKKTSPPVSGCNHVLADSRGRVIFPVKSAILNLDSSLTGLLTVTGIIRDTEEGEKILIISSVDRKPVR